jgi:hypothetical protein
MPDSTALKQPLTLPPASDQPQVERPPKPAELSPRRRGGQPGNNNALKHGFYSSKFPAGVRKDLAEYTFSGLTEEIELLRVYIRSLVELTAKLDDVDRAIAVVRTLGFATTSITRLLRIQKQMFAQDESSDLLNQWIDAELARLRAGESALNGRDTIFPPAFYTADKPGS